jgi:hypothetical protein
MAIILALLGTLGISGQPIYVLTQLQGDQGGGVHVIPRVRLRGSPMGTTKALLIGAKRLEVDLIGQCAELPRFLNVLLFLNVHQEIAGNLPSMRACICEPLRPFFSSYRF